MNHNGRSLKQSILNFVRNADTLAIYVPYIKLNLLKEILAETDNCHFIIVRWEVKDLLEGASDLEIYELCKEKNISLFRNPRLHLKLYRDSNSAYLTTANISSRAMNDGKFENYNYELGTKIENLEFEDRLYLQNILDSSLLVDDEMIEQIKDQLSLLAFDEDGSDFEFNHKPFNREFLLSSLPMSLNLTDFKKYYREKRASTQVDFDCLIHDLSIYEISLGLTDIELENQLRKKFFQHPFIIAFLEELESAGGDLYFGRVRQWLAANCADCPIPRAWEVTQNVQILYHWIEYLGKGKYKVDVPGSHSQRIRIVS